ncbi:MAG TPA: TonB-dependent receptor [Steroidobacteraceae bacterium]|nr:TonB-dependent receptor [Steroidobacteraceae bacterium]
MTLRNRLLIIASLWLCTALGVAQAQQSSVAGATSSAPVATKSISAATTSGDMEEVVVNGIKRGDLIMPTTVTSDSAYGLDLGVMDTPRNNTVLSKVQIDALNVQNPGGFSALTSSAYSDASFGQPNVPRIRGQLADVFFNGMRDSFTLNGYGAPMSFVMVDSIDIVKGPASVQGGAGAGVGGSIDITTKVPSSTNFSAMFDTEFDTQQKRIVGFDVGGPLSSNVAGRVSFISNDSGSYYYDMFFHQQQVYAVLVDQITSNYTISVNGSFVDTQYRENDGINRLNQGLINNGTYLTGAPPLDEVEGYGTLVDLTGSTRLNERTIIDEPDGTGAHSQHAMLQAIQTYRVNDNFSIVNNTFYDYMNRYNQTEDYYADTAIGSYTVENKTDFKFNFNLGAVANQVDTGFTYRYAHVLDIQNYVNEPVSVFDLSQDPSTWIFPAANQDPSGGAILYNAAFGHQQYGVAASNFITPNTSVDSNLQDAAVFLEHRLQFSSQWSMLYGLRADAVQLNDSDPLYYQVLADPIASGFMNGDPPTQHTAWYGLYNGNVSVVYAPTSWISSYLTYNKAQYVDANDNDGSIATLGLDPTTQLRQKTLLEEGGLKLDLLGKALFLSMAGFKQERTVPTGQGGMVQSKAHITGGEVELNFQPNSRFFATASYSYLHTTLDTPAGFWNFPAQPGINIDGAGGSIAYEPGQTFQDPGVPEHLFNALVNYKLDNGLGFQANVQVTGPIQTTQAGAVDVAATEQNLLNNFGPGSFIGYSAATALAALPPSIAATGYYRPPTIPWQYSINAGVFYNFLQHYTVKFEIYNLTNERNLQNDYSFYGNDFLTVIPPRSYDLTFTAKL